MIKYGMEWAKTGTILGRISPHRIDSHHDPSLEWHTRVGTQKIDTDRKCDGPSLECRESYEIYKKRYINCFHLRRDS